jgi:hypothetical protein
MQAGPAVPAWRRACSNFICELALSRSPRLIPWTPETRFPRWIMYEAKKDRIDRLHTRFDREVADRDPMARRTGQEYLEALSDFIRTYDDGPAGDPKVAGVDTTGELTRVEEQAAWAEQERHRVRRALNDVR